MLPFDTRERAALVADLGLVAWGGAFDQRFSADNFSVRLVVDDFLLSYVTPLLLDPRAGAVAHGSSGQEARVALAEFQDGGHFTSWLYADGAPQIEASLRSSHCFFAEKAYPKKTGRAQDLGPLWEVCWLVRVRGRGVG